LVGDVPREALALTAAALADLRLGACEGAAARLDAAAPLLGQYAALRRQHALTHILVALDCGATEDAARRLAEAARQGWDRGWLAPQFALAAGRVARLQGDLDAARTHLGPLLGHHDALVRAEAHGQLGEALLAAGRSEPADAHLARWSAARRQYIEGGGPLSRARFMSADHVARVGRWARARADRGDIAGALDALSALQSMAFLEALMARVRGAVPRPAAGAWIDAFVSAAGPGTPRSAGRLLDDLPPEVAVLLPYPLESETFVFLAWRRAGGSPRVVLERVPAGRAELARRVARLRARLQSGQAGFETDASWLAARLVEPVASTLASTGARSLAVIPHGPLHDLPFAMLPSGGVPLVDRVPVFDAPSLPALIALVAPGVAPDAPTRPLVVADAAGDLPGARRNARALGVALPGASVLVGADARVGRVLPALAHADLVHFAVHGHHARTGGPGWLALADGALDADRVASARLRGAPLVVLASCETGQGEPAPADDVPGVLDRAFLAAGARAVVSTRWRIDDGSAARFFQAFYAARSGRTLVDALASAQRAVRDMTAPADVVGRRTRGLIPRAPTAGPERLDHPYHWAGFRLMGDPR
jgi:CHAT domain-containing protein